MKKSKACSKLDLVLNDTLCERLSAETVDDQNGGEEYESC